MQQAIQTLDLDKNAYTAEIITNQGPIRLTFFPDKATGLLPGMFVQVAIAVQARQGITAIPSAAIVQTSSGASVFVVQDGVAHQVPITTGLTDGTQTEITSGVRPGQQVVVDGQQSLVDGQKVTATSSSAG